MNSTRTYATRYPLGSVLAGKYRVEGVLGVGGMGVVLSVTHLVLHERVALKVLHAEGARPARILREARAAAKLRGLHVARVLDAGVLADGGPFVAYEHLSGQDLGDLELPLPVSQAARLVLQLCEALAEAHRAGIVHRDLKPSNVFLTTAPDGSMVAKLLDFGLAKFVDEPTSELTQSAAIVGSPLYMAPEQIRDPRHVDARVDLWALGVLMHELLSGRRPFEGQSSTAVLAAVAADAPIGLAEHAPQAPSELCALVAECLIKDPNERLSNLAELAQRLAPFTPGGAEHAERVQRILTRPVPPQEDNASGATTQDPEDLTDHEDLILAASHQDPTSTSLGGSRPAIGSTSSSVARPRHRARSWTIGVVVLLLIGAAFLGLREDPKIAEARPSAPAVIPSAEPSVMVFGETTAEVALPEPMTLPSASASAAPRLIPSAPARMKSPTVRASTTPPSPHEGRHW
jgi:serine/threonine-protein kinase